ncbi:MAG: amino acid permease [Vicinamibacterales bacterium]
MAQAPAAPPTLERRLGSMDAAAIVVSNVIGGGILFTPPQVAATVPDPLLFLLTWLAAGALAFAGAMAYAELAALRPRAGGEYVYLDAGFGRLAAFLTGWTSFVAGFSGAIAASAVVLAFYLGRFLPMAGSDRVLLSVPLGFGLAITVAPQTLTALAAIWLMSWIHLRGVGPGRLVGNVLASLKVTALVLFILFGFAFGTGSFEHFSAAAGRPGTGAWLFALIPVLFTYAGWNAASYVAEEVRDPGTNVPRALALGTAAVVVIYLLLNALYLYVLPVGELAAVNGSVLDVIADRLLGSRAGDIMGVVSIVSLLASISAMVFAGPRVYYAMARDGVFLPVAGRVHPAYRTPATSIVAQALWSTVLVLTGSATALTTYTGFSITLFNGVAVAALFVLRWREPDAPRPYSTWGYPFVPGLFVLACALIVVNALWADLVRPLAAGTAVGPSAAGLLVIAAGLPLYAWFTRRRTRG